MTDLLHRLREGEGADGTLDIAISEKFDHWIDADRYGVDTAPQFTSSLDACIALAVELGRAPDLILYQVCEDLIEETAETLERVTAGKICRRICIALITAKEQEHDR